MSKKNIIIILIVALIIIAGTAFYGGMVYGKSQNARPAFNATNFQGLRGSRTSANGASLISGNILSTDSSSITLQLPNSGGSKIIFYSSSTQINKFTSGTAADLTSGTTVSITGTTNSDGSVTAQSIQIRPATKNL
jgi:hypothetical protein